MNLSNNDYFWQKFLIPEIVELSLANANYKTTFLQSPQYRKIEYRGVDRVGRIYQAFEEVLIPEYCRTHASLECILPLDEFEKKIAGNKPRIQQTACVEKLDFSNYNDDSFTWLIENNLLFPQNIPLLSAQQRRTILSLKKIILHNKNQFPVLINLDNKIIERLIDLQDLFLENICSIQNLRIYKDKEIDIINKCKALILAKRLTIEDLLKFDAEKIKIVEKLGSIILSCTIPIQDLLSQDVSYFCCLYLAELLTQNIIQEIEAIPILYLLSKPENLSRNFANNQCV